MDAVYVVETDASGVAFLALQQLVDYSVLMGSIIIFASFVSVQFVYFIMIRWRYLQRLQRKLT